MIEYKLTNFETNFCYKVEKVCNNNLDLDINTVLKIYKYNLSFRKYLFNLISIY